MKNNYVVISLCISFFLIFISCEKEPSIAENNPLIIYLDHIDIPCNSPNTIKKILLSDDYLYGYTYEDDTLHIEFKFINTCGSAYQDSTNMNGNRIYISLNDISKSHFRCICQHETNYWFHVVNAEKINLILDIKFYTQDNFTTCVDTILYLE